MKLKMGKLRFNRSEEPVDHEDIYTDDGLAQKADSDEISDYEDAFMRGWLSC